MGLTAEPMGRDLEVETTTIQEASSCVCKMAGFLFQRENFRKSLLLESDYLTFQDRIGRNV